LEKLLRLEL
jgi:hypothetical protein